MITSLVPASAMLLLPPLLLLLPLGSRLSDAAPCASPQLAPPLLVEDTHGVLQLAEMANCSGGSFNVEWVGSVIVNETIRLFGGTTLSITGADDGASVMDGANGTSLIEVDGGTLHLHRISLVNGAADRGGAIYATGATITTASCVISNNAGVDGAGVFLNSSVLETTNSTFSNNTASGHGGVMYVEASNITLGTNVQLEHNEASFGGALYVVGGSTLAVTGDNISIEGNIAYMHGGGLYVHRSTANVTGNAVLIRNTARVGGAIYTDNASLSIGGDVLFLNNLASEDGGAFYGWISAFDIAGATVWENNSALARGGGLFISETTWHLHVLGKATFVGNAADWGSAAYLHTSVVVVDGDTYFAENHAGVRGGALYSDASTVNISGHATLENNRAPLDGGGLYSRWSAINVARSGRVEFFGNTAEFGGAAYVNEGVLLIHGDVIFSNNFATANGGALYVGYSGAEITGYAVWENNTAGGGGGALSTLSSNFSVQPLGKASFVGNDASSVGGGVYVARCSIIFDGEVSFSENSVVERGGALHSDRSVISIAGTVLWAKNSAQGSGGALSTWASELRVHDSGIVEFHQNAAVYAGALYSAEGTVFLGGSSLFENNTAEDEGGAVRCRDSDVDISGTAVWKHNTANYKGGAISMVSSNVSVYPSGRASFVGNDAVSAGGAVYVSSCSIFFDGKVSFSENSALEDGGALHSDGSVITITGTVLWVNNLAQRSGGALTMRGTELRVHASGIVEFRQNAAMDAGALSSSGGTVFLGGKSLFENNSAEDKGGAFLCSDSEVDVSGTAVWHNNTASGRGGAILSFNSEIVVQSSGTAEFVGNNGTQKGGASYVYNTSLLLKGDVNFTENVAGTGGALYIDNSVVVVNHTTTWERNSAPQSGGAAYIWNTTLHVTSFGTAVFFRNDAAWGGALYPYESSLLFDGGVLFSQNSAIDFGGACFGHRSAVTVTGTTSWRVNTCESNGGGLALVESTFLIEKSGNASFRNNTASVGGGMWIGEDTVVVVTGLATVSHNRAQNGGGIKMAQFSSLDSSGGVVTVMENVAWSNGGGMHCESPTLLRLDGAQFISNYALVNGGAMMTLSAGMVRVRATEEADPAIISNCSFSDNYAADTGGALFIGGGFVDIVGSRFHNNTAGRSGGALLASGIVNLYYCVLIGNHAGIGPAVTNTVSVSFLSVDFINNTLWCDDRTLFLDWNDTSSFAMACESCSGSCTNCTVETPDRVQQCQPVLEHTTSLNAHGDLELLSLHSGFWRSSSVSKDIRECYEPSACVGGAEQYCREGYEGPLCAVCGDGYTAGLGYTCSECSPGRRHAAIAIVAIVLAVAVVAVARSLKFLASNEGQAPVEDNSAGGSSAEVQPFLRARAFQALKVLVVSWQIVTQFSLVASVVYPDVYNTLLTYADVVNLNVGWMLSAGCLIDTDFYHQLLLSTILPLVVFGGVGVSHKIATRNKSTRASLNRAQIDRRHATVIFWVSFMCYATVSSTIFQAFACNDLDTGVSYLRVDHSLECYTAEHKLFQVYAGVMCVVYPFGIPFSYAVILHRGRATLKDPVARKTCDVDGAVLRELWIAYRPEAYFYEVVESVRRVVLSGVIVFIFPNTAGQIATAFLLALFFAAVFLVLDPYTSSFDTWAARVGHMVVLMSMFVALLQKVNFGGEDGFSQGAFAVVLILANAVMVAAVVAEACGMCVVVVQEIRQPVAKLIRRTESIPGRSALQENVNSAQSIKRIHTSRFQTNVDVVRAIEMLPINNVVP